jgi:hypothetical protein
MNFLLHLLGPKFLDGLIMDVYPFKAPSNSGGRKWFKINFGESFVTETETLTMELIQTISQNSTISTFISMGLNGRRLLNAAKSKFPASHRVSTVCCHPHRFIVYRTNLEIAKILMIWLLY